MNVSRAALLCSAWALANLVSAGAVIELVPAKSANVFNPSGSYLPGETVAVEVRLKDSTAGGDRLIRLVQLNFDATDSSLTVQNVQWQIGAAGHYKDESLGSGPPGVAVAYYFVDSADLGPNPAAQAVLPGDGSAVSVGMFEVVMPAAPGSYDLDVRNASAASRDLAARVGFGFGLEAGDPVTDWSATDGALSGNALSLTVVDQALAETLPGFDGTLWRTANNAVQLTFDRDISAPAAGEVEIRELLGAGGLGPDLSASFTATVSNDGGGNPRVLTLVEQGTVLTDGTWYAVQNGGAWSSVGPFRVHGLLRRGDASGDAEVQFADLALINVSVNAGSGEPTDRADVDGDGLVQFADLAAANVFIGQSGVEKPDGHE